MLQIRLGSRSRRSRQQKDGCVDHLSVIISLSLSPSDRNFVILAEGVPGERRVCRHLARFIRFLHLASFAPNLLQVRFLSILRLASLQFDVI